MPTKYCSERHGRTLRNGQKENMMHQTPAEKRTFLTSELKRLTAELNNETDAKRQAKIREIISSVNHTITTIKDR